MFFTCFFVVVFSRALHLMHFSPGPKVRTLQCLSLCCWLLKQQKLESWSHTDYVTRTLPTLHTITCVLAYKTTYEQGFGMIFEGQEYVSCSHEDWNECLAHVKEEIKDSRCDQTSSAVHDLIWLFCNLWFSRWFVVGVILSSVSGIVYTRKWCSFDGSVVIKFHDVWCEVAPSGDSWW